MYRIAFYYHCLLFYYIQLNPITDKSFAREFCGESSNYLDDMMDYFTTMSGAMSLNRIMETMADG